MKALAVPAGLLLLLAAVLVHTATMTSVTADEFFHVPVGLAYWQTGDFALYHHNPPLVRLLASAPLALAGVRAPLEGGPLEPWPLGERFLIAYASRYHELFLWARLVVILMTCATGALVYWAARPLGTLSAAAALGFFVTCPTVLAHGSLATTDAGFTLAFFAAVLQAGRTFSRPSWGRIAALGCLLGVALLTKLTALLLVPLLVLAGLALPWTAAPIEWRTLGTKARALRLLAVMGGALVILNIGYLFQGTGTPLAAHELGHPLLRSLAASPLGGLPVPLPREYVLGFDDQYVEASGLFAVYLLGETRTEGWWYYYPLVLLFKLPLPLLAAGLALVVAILCRRLTLTPLLAGVLFVTTFAFVAFAAFTNIDLGIRYLLFLLPFLHLAIAHLVAAPASRTRVVLVAAALATQAASTWSTHPHYIAYFNEAAGRWPNGHRYLADSNLDWGQDLVHLRRFMQENGVGSVALSHFGPVDPGVYGIAWRPLDAPSEGGLAVVSVNHLLGITPWGEPPGIERYRGRAPLGRVGASLWIFREE